MLEQMHYREKALAFIEGLTFNSIYFKVLLKLACISSSAKIHKEIHGMPNRCRIFEEETNPFWLQWDFGRALVTLLVEQCKPRNVDPSESNFWTLLDSHYQQSYFEQYEFCREVEVMPCDFESLCKAIMNDNTILIADFKLSPRELDEADGHYGEAVCWRKWWLEKDSKLIAEFHTDCYSLAEKVFYTVNGRVVRDNERGAISHKLEWYSE